MVANLSALRDAVGCIGLLVGPSRPHHGHIGSTSFKIPALQETQNGDSISTKRCCCDTKIGACCSNLLTIAVRSLSKKHTPILPQALAEPHGWGKPMDFHLGSAQKTLLPSWSHPTLHLRGAQPLQVPRCDHWCPENKDPGYPHFIEPSQYHD